MKSFTQKKAELSKIKDKLSKAKITIFTSFSRAGEKGLNVTEMNNLKKQLRGVEAEYLVSKKTLLDRVLTATHQNADISTQTMDGSVALAFGYGDVAATAKALYGFSRKNPALKLFGALWGSQSMNQANLVEFAKLPSREVLLGRIMGLLQYPLSAFANTLQQIADKK